MAKKKYFIATTGGITPGIGPFGVSAMSMLIWSAENPSNCFEYAVLGGSGGFTKAKLAIGVGPTSPSDFESEVSSPDQFYGQVQSNDLTAALGIGYNWQKMTWLSGPAKGTVCEGTGWLTMIGASIGTSGAIYTFKLPRKSPNWFQQPAAAKYEAPEIRRTSRRQF